MITQKIFRVCKLKLKKEMDPVAKIGGPQKFVDEVSPLALQMHRAAAEDWGVRSRVYNV